MPRSYPVHTSCRRSTYLDCPSDLQPRNRVVLRPYYAWVLAAFVLHSLHQTVFMMNHESRSICLVLQHSALALFGILWVSPIPAVLSGVAIFIVQKILLDETGLTHICHAYERFFAVGTVLSNMVNQLVETQAVRLLKHVVHCHLRLSDNPRAPEALRACLPEPLRDNTFAALLQVSYP